MKILNNFEQRSMEWLDARTGLITMSHAKELLTGGKGVTRATYLRQVAAELLGGRIDDGYQSRDMIRGMELEPFALRAYEHETGVTAHTVGFALHDDARIGCSPDGLTTNSGLEIKCPRPQFHLRYLDAAAAIKEHGPQMQGEMWVCERDTWDFVSFCPWVKDRPIVIHQVKRDEEMIKRLSESALRGADEVAAMVGKIQSGASPKAKTATIAAEAVKYWSALTMGTSSEVQIDE